MNRLIAASRQRAGRRGAAQAEIASQARNALPVALRQSGFTLVELLVTITIIAMLAGMSLYVLGAVQETARADRTKATIAKINTYVMEQYESYRTRRVPVSTMGLNPLQAAQRRLDALRDLMRMEMPERWNDVINDPYSYAWGSIQRPAVSQSYRRRYDATTPTGDYGSAECLYMFVMTLFPDAREHFNDSEIGDVDDDGWHEFLDGWGNPIRFLRWAPGFNDSDVQRNVYDNTSSSYNTSLVDDAIANDHDPFDKRRVDAHAWRLVPLIFSAGPDGIYDISMGGAAHHYQENPYWDSTNSVYWPIGDPVDSANTSVTADGPANGSLDHYDNITNHRIEVR